MNTSKTSKKKKDKYLPWWVELLFVQIGLPDKFLIKILKAKKTAKELIKNEKKLLILFFFFIITLAYFYPVIKHSKNKLNCESIAKNYIIKNKNIIIDFFSFLINSLDVFLAFNIFISNLSGNPI